jgi:alpha-amylase/alpha-mannosidase (GH57 family)
VERILTTVDLDILDQSRYIFIQITLHYSHEVEYLTHDFSESLAALLNEHGTSGSVARNSDH